MPELRTKLIFKLSSPDALTPCASAQRVSGLYHELLDHPVEDVPVEVGVPRVHAEVLHRFRALLRNVFTSYVSKTELLDIHNFSQADDKS